MPEGLNETHVAVGSAGIFGTALIAWGPKLFRWFTKREHIDPEKQALRERVREAEDTARMERIHTMLHEEGSLTRKAIYDTSKEIGDKLDKVNETLLKALNHNGG